MPSRFNHSNLLSVAIPVLAGWTIAACTVVNNPTTPATPEHGTPSAHEQPAGPSGNASDPATPATPAPEPTNATNPGHVPSVPDGALSPPDGVPADPHTATPAPPDARKDPGSKPPPVGPRIPAPRIPAGASNRADGAACSTASQCASGICEGLGCEPDQGTCAPKQRSCTKDLRSYCGCDGTTFSGSGSCPMRVFLHPGPCKER